MAKGGARKGAGRPIGSANLKTRELANRAAENGLTPLEFLLQVVRDESVDPAKRLDAAKAAAPFCHPRLSAIAFAGSVEQEVPERSTRELAKKIAFLFARAVHEAKSSGDNQHIQSTVA